MVLENDARGWIMTGVSGAACIIGSSIIFVDYLVRLFPHKRNFAIQNSNGFLSASLSLSFGVMLFSALYGMLPSAKNYLQKGGLAPRSAGFVLIGCFLSGVVGIQIVSGFLHKFIPSHVVDCDHTHEEESKEDDSDDSDDFHEAADPCSHHDHHSAPQFSSPSYPSDRSESAMISTETSPLILRHQDNANMPHSLRGMTPENVPFSNALGARRPPLHSRITSGVIHLVAPESSCKDVNGPCYGFSDPCGQECFKHIHSNSAIDRRSSVMSARFRPSYFRRRTSTPRSQYAYPSSLGDLNEEEPTTNGRLPDGRPRSLEIQKTIPNHIRHSSHGPTSGDLNIEEGTTNAHTDPAHHHHVPENAFLSIGLQTSIAIALHKLPEGFITYATNHANSQLGFAVFMALFIHNITEGFAMALPLFLALGSRWKAMFWSSLLGGISQPLGAGVASIWFKLAGKGDMAPGERIYGAMFAVTSGIMASVALQLFTESMSLNHNHRTCTTFAFLGMGILGVSFALTAE